LIWC
jgi:hypothetical protein